MKGWPSPPDAGRGVPGQGPLRAAEGSGSAADGSRQLFIMTWRETASFLPTAFSILNTARVSGLKDNIFLVSDAFSEPYKMFTKYNEMST